MIMQLVLPNSRASLTKEDLNFIACSLTTGVGEDQAIHKLMTDAQSLDLILDKDELWSAIIESTEPLKISLEFYFYILVRRVLLRNGIADRETADYVAAVLANKTRLRQDALQSLRNSPLLCTTDWSIEFENAPDSYRFELLTFAAETLLVATGLFPDHIAWREKRRASPSIDWYASRCRQGYQEAGKHRLAKRYHMKRIYSEIADCFPTIKGALNTIQSEFLTFKQLPNYNVSGN